jgi:DNA-binding LytR/AlgR family response regulator
MIRTAIIVDDEPLLRAQLRASLLSLWPELKILAEADHGEAALALMQEQQPDFAFLDIEMPGMSGLDVAARAKSVAPATYIVFVTAYDQYAIDAFERGAIDYLLKPASKARLTNTISRLQSRASQIAQPQLADILESIRVNILANAAPQFLKWIHASIGVQTTLIAVDDVMYFQSDTKYTRVTLLNPAEENEGDVAPGSDYLIRLPLTELVEKLDPNKFRQIHRSTIISLAAVRLIEKDDAGNISIALKKSRQILKVSRSFAHQFKTM